MEKMKMESVNITDKNIEKIAALFPNCITETADENGKLKKAINFEMLRAVLSEDIAEGDEAYEFTWVGKKAAIAEANRPIRKTLRPVINDETVPTGKDSEGNPYCSSGSVNWDNTENLYIEGDNLDVLKLLQESYLGKVKMIYIDPPYNTGNDFIYRDNFAMSSDEYEEQLSMFDEEGNRLFKNTDSNGRFHSDWCSMIYSRLMLARNLLTDNGLIMISIDDNELNNIIKICNEVFGEENFVDNVIWKKRYGGGAKEKYLVTLQEYVLIYCKNIHTLEEIFVPLSKESAERYYNKKDEKFSTRGGYRTHPLEAGKAMDSRPNLIYPIPAPDGTQIMPRRQWLWSKERAYEALKNGDLEIVKGKDNNWVVSSKQYLREVDGTIRPGKMFSIIEDIYTQHGTNEMISIFGNAKVFSYPKPSEFVKRLLTICSYDKDMIVLDFFSGSSSTAHALMQLNAEDGGHRKFIMVQYPETTAEDSDAYKEGYKNICEIGKERIRRAGVKIKEESPMTTQNLDTGFRVLKLDETNMEDVYYSPAETNQSMLAGFESNIKPDRNSLDLLYGCLLDWGLPLSMSYSSEKIDGVTVHTYCNKDGALIDLIACFDKAIPESVIKTIAKRQPLRVVFRDDSFADSPSKINVSEIFKMFSPDTRVKVI